MTDFQLLPRVSGGDWANISTTSNRLTFEDLLSNVTAASGKFSFSYAPQKWLYPDTSMAVLPGSTIIIDLGIDSAVMDNEYYWYKDSIPFDTLIGVNRLVLEDIQDADFGVYTVQVTNPRVPGLILESGDIFVHSSCPDTPPAHLKSDQTTLCLGDSVSFWVELGEDSQFWDIRYRIDTVEYTVQNYLSGTKIVIYPTQDTEIELLSAELEEGCGAELLDSVWSVRVRAVTPKITATDTSLCVGGTTTLRAGNITSATKVQWERSWDGGVWSALSGATDTLLRVTATEEGPIWYRVQALEGACTNASNVVRLIVKESLPQPMVLGASPICVGDSLDLSVVSEVGYAGLSYRWLSSVNNTTFTAVSGAMQEYLRISRSTAGISYYRVEVRSAAPGCGTKTSASFALTAVAKPAVTINAGQRVVCAGSGIALASALSTPATGQYQWQVSTDSMAWTDIAGANASTYTVLSESTGMWFYRVVFGLSTAPCEVASAGVRLSWIRPAEVSVVPVSSEVCVSGKTVLRTNVLFSGSTTPVYSWQSSLSANGAWTTIAGATGASYTAPARTSPGMMYYRVQVNTGTVGCASVFAQPQGIRTVEKLSVSAALAEPQICEGGETLLLVNRKGSTGAHSYTWEYSLNKRTWTRLGSGTDSTQAVRPTQAGLVYYRAVVSSAGSGCGTSLVTNQVTLSVARQVPVSMTTTTPVLCAGGTVSLRATVATGFKATQYTWQRSFNGMNWNDMGTPSSSSTYSGVVEGEGKQYYRVLATISNSGCGISTSNQVEISVNPLPVLELAANETEACIGGPVVLETKPVSAVAPYGSAVYTWQHRTEGGTWQTLSGVSGDRYTVPTTTASSRYYRVRGAFALAGCSADTTEELLITINPKLSISVQAAATEVCTGGSTELLLQVSGGTGALGVQWLKGRTLGVYSPVEGGNTEQLVIDAVETGATYYQVRVRDEGLGCGTDISLASPITIRGVASPVVRVTGPKTAICTGTQTSLQAYVSGGTGTIQYQWQESADGYLWENIALNGKKAQYQPPTETAGSTYYRAYIWMDGSACADVYSNIIEVQVADASVVGMTMSADAVCLGATVELSATLEGSIPAQYYRWQFQYENSTKWNTIKSQSQSTLRLTATTSGAVNYRVQAYLGSCGLVSSEAQTLWTARKPVVTILAPLTAVCQNTPVTLEARVNGGIGYHSFQWQRATATGAFSNIEGATEYYYSPSTVRTGILRYRVIVTPDGPGCGGAVVSTNTVSLVVLSNCPGQLDGLLPMVAVSEVVSRKQASSPLRLPVQSIVPVGAEVAVSAPQEDLSLHSVEETEEAVVLFQNQPNPFSGETIIRFYLPESSEATLLIQDLTGRILHRISKTWEAGYQEIEVSSNLLNGKGIYLYTLQTAGTRLTRKMIMLEP